VVWPATRFVPPDGAWEEIPPTGGAFPLHAPSALAPFLVWFRGLFLDAHIRTLGPDTDQRALVLDRPVPCDGRLGADVGPFLPLRVTRLDRGGPPTLRVQEGDRVALLETFGERFVQREATPGTPTLCYESRFGFHPTWPKEFTGRYAWGGLMFGVDGAGFGFLGWLLDPGYHAPPTPPFRAYGFRAGRGGVSGPLRIRAGDARPPLPPEVHAALEEMLAGVGAPLRTVGPVVLSACYDDPRQAPVWVELDDPPSATLPCVRLFRRCPELDA
jgi:hypothetical protein